MPSEEFSIICFEFLGDFWRKSQKEAKKEKLGKNRATSLRRRGCFTAARPRAKMATPRVRCSIALLRRSEVTVHSEPKFLFIFRKSRIRALIV